ncbi:hypothetical protein [Rubellicoccus peritrichatus]|uniref:Tape measure domain-containing protein n=1 Tax=Rubellicoccus peritrichatus TaxID=3080537 RepID=A0AAQ3LG28_9BACT|nr:hypothetical protein [Puniceicoccus sp. CR14]WOO43168.1 hypothetical protein RZN69_08685 [Puniceicoccus sp. CR14]
MPRSIIDIMLKTKADLTALKKFREEAKRSVQLMADGFRTRIGQRAFDSFARLPGMITQAAKAGIDFNAEMEQLQISFGTLLGNADKAKDRIQDLVNFSASTPFQIRDIAGASRLLQALTGDALASGEGLRLVGDAAAAVGAPFQAAAMWIGRLYAGLKTGTPVGEATMRLTELGLVTGESKRELEELAKTARSEEEAFDIIQKTFANTSGAMAKQAESFSGMVSTLKDNLSILAGELTRGPFEQLSASLETILILMGKLDTSVEQQLKASLSEIQFLHASVANATSETAGPLLEHIEKRIATERGVLLKLQSDFNRFRELQDQSSLSPTGQMTISKPGFMGSVDRNATAELENFNSFFGDFDQGLVMIKQQQSQLAKLQSLLRELASKSKGELDATADRIEAEKQHTIAQKILQTIEARSEKTAKELEKAKEARRTDAQRLKILKDQRATVFGRAIEAEMFGGLSPEELDRLNAATKQQVDLLNLMIEALESKELQSRAKQEAAVTSELIQQTRMEREIAAEQKDRAKVEGLVIREKELLGQLIEQYRKLASAIRETDPARAASLDTAIAGLEQQRETVGGNDTGGANTIGGGFEQLQENLESAQGIANQTFNTLNTGINAFSSNMVLAVNGAQSLEQTFSNVGKAIIDQLVAMTAQALAFAAISAVLGVATGGASTLAGGFMGGLSGFFGFANGGIMDPGRGPRKLSRFASGGVSNTAAIFGEAGPEAAVPLPDGRSIPVTISQAFPQPALQSLSSSFFDDSARGWGSARSEKPDRVVIVDDRRDAMRYRRDPEFRNTFHDMSRREAGKLRR